MQATIDFQGVEAGAGLNAGNSLTANQNAVGGALNALLAQGVTLDFMTALANLPSQSALGDALEQFAPLGSASVVDGTLLTSQLFGQQLLSCKELDDDEFSAIAREGQCVWVRATANSSRQESDGTGSGFDSLATLYSAGLQVDLGGPWRLGGAVAGEASETSVSRRGSIETDKFHAGAVLKYDAGSYLLAASLTGGVGTSEQSRKVHFAGNEQTATSDFSQHHYAGSITGSYLFDFGHWYLKPQIEGTWTYVHQDGYEERSDGGVALIVDSYSDAFFGLSSTVELGTEFKSPDGGGARPYIKAGFGWTDSDSVTTSAAFSGAGGDFGTFDTINPIDNQFLELGAGVDLHSSIGAVLRLQYGARIGAHTDQHSGSAKFSVAF